MNAFKKSLLAAGLAATTLAAASPAMARPYDYHHGGGTGAAVGAGILGLAVGAIVASSVSHRDRYYDDAGYYDYDAPLPSGWFVRDGYYWDDYGHRYSRDEFRQRFPGGPGRGDYGRGDYGRGDHGYSDHRGPDGRGGPGGDERRGFNRDGGDARRGF